MIIHGLMTHPRLMLSFAATYTHQFYFAVQSGATFDIDFEVRDPNDKNLLDGKAEKQGDYVLTANTPGEYSFCFTNDMTSLSDKFIDFDIMVESEPRREPSAKPGQISDHSSALEESIFRLNGQLMSMKRTQKLCVIRISVVRTSLLTISSASTPGKTEASPSSSLPRGESFSTFYIVSFANGAPAKFSGSLFWNASVS